MSDRGRAPEPSEDGPLPSLWRSPDYVGWWTGNTVSAVGTSLSAIAFPLLVLYTTGSVARAGMIGAANLAGMLITTLLGGALADRVSRKAILVLSPLVQGAVLAAVATAVATDRASLPLLVAAALAGGLSAGVVTGAEMSALRRIVPKEQLPVATGQMMGRDLGADLIGAPLGGVLFAVTRWFPFAADAVSFVFAAVGALLIRRPLGPDRSAAVRRNSVTQDIAAGIRFVREQPFLRFTVIWGALLNTVTEAFTLLFIALIRYRGGGPAQVGLISSLALLGGLVGAVIGPSVARRVRPQRVLYAAAWAFAATLAACAFVPRPWQIGAVVTVAMLTMVPLNVVLQAAVVRVVPDEFSGRVAAVGRFGTMALQWTGPLVAGLLASLFGVPGAVLSLLVPVALLALALHATRSLDAMDVLTDDVRVTSPKEKAPTEA
ncbi:MFS transporter [Actinomadura macra]|uniref:MFS transporter n=1 Tax=Actinomadura macra TaxID=46164 RepID=UPI00082BC905|nr:MFS transporter [Actinomadura macra]